MSAARRLTDEVRAPGASEVFRAVFELNECDDRGTDQNWLPPSFEDIDVENIFQMDKLPVSDAFRLCRIVRSNHLQLGYPTVGDVPAGVGLFLEAAYFNHSCWPNCVAYTEAIPGTKTHVLCVRTIRKIVKGDELCLRYLPETACLPKRPRRQLLLSEYGFLCHCERCEHPNFLGNDRQMEGLRCSVDACPGTLLQSDDPSVFRCDGVLCAGQMPLKEVKDCVRRFELINKEIHSRSTFQAFKLARRGAGKLPSAEKMTVLAVDYDRFLAQAERRLHPHHNLLSRLRLAAGDLALATGDIQKARHVFGLAYDAALHSLPPNDPALLPLCFAVAQASSTGADKWLLRAIGIHSMCFGGGQAAFWNHYKHAIRPDLKAALLKLEPESNVASTGVDTATEIIDLARRYRGPDPSPIASGLSVMPGHERILTRLATLLVAGDVPDHRQEVQQLLTLDISTEERSSGRLSRATVALGGKIFQQAGMVILPNVFTREFLDNCRDQCLERFTLLREKAQRAHVLEILEHGDGFAEIRSRTNGRFDMTVPQIQEALQTKSLLYRPLLEALLGTDNRLMRAGCVFANPNPKSQAWHSDGGQLFPQNPGLPPYCVNLFVPLLDMTPDLGPTEFALGTHNQKVKSVYALVVSTGGLDACLTFIETPHLASYLTLSFGLTYILCSSSPASCLTLSFGLTYCLKLQVFSLKIAPCLPLGSVILSDFRHSHNIILFVDFSGMQCSHPIPAASQAWSPWSG